MLAELFSSKVRVELLKLFFFNTSENFYQRQISLRTAQPIRGVQREVERLQKAGLLDKFLHGNRVYYALNKKFPIYEELKRIVLKSAGVAGVLKDCFNRTGGIRIAFVYGSYAKNEERRSSDIDLLVIGNITSRKLATLLSGSRKELGREMHYVVFPPEEFAQKLAQGNHFLTTLMNEKKIFIVGSENELNTIAGRR